MDVAILDRYDMYMTNQISGALDGVLDIEKVYWLSDDDKVAPEPNQSLFGTADSPGELGWLLEAAADLLGCHGDDEGSDVHLGGDGTVDKANQNADGQTHEDSYGDGQLTGCDGAGAESTGQRHDSAHRQVDTAGDDNQAHTQSQVTVGEQLTQNVQNVAAGQETVIEQGNDHTQGEEANENTQILFEILLYTFGKSFHIA
jgi:hypothetical protein